MAGTQGAQPVSNQRLAYQRQQLRNVVVRSADIMQVVLLRGWCRRGSFRSERRPRGLLCRDCLCRCCDALRRRTAAKLCNGGPKTCAWGTALRQNRCAFRAGISWMRVDCAWDRV